MDSPAANPISFLHSKKLSDSGWPESVSIAFRHGFPCGESNLFLHSKNQLIPAGRESALNPFRHGFSCGESNLFFAQQKII